MIKIEISEVKRKIEVSRKDIPNVPKLADEIVQLKNELNIEKEKERRLADELGIISKSQSKHNRKSQQQAEMERFGRRRPRPRSS
jgi:predicted  nucleic acid-binding Zn-ribbon protein